MSAAASADLPCMHHTLLSSCRLLFHCLTCVCVTLRQGSPVARKAIVVAPATLVANWGKEVNKWLGSERLRFIQLPQGPEAAAKVRPCSSAACAL